MLIVPSTIAPEKLLPLLKDGSEVCFAETECIVTVSNGRAIGETRYGYIDFVGAVSEVEPLVHWARSWAPLPDRVISRR